MPETTVDKNDLPMTWKYDVRRSWQVLSMEPKSLAQRMQYTSNLDLRFSVLPANRLHSVTCGRRYSDISGFGFTLRSHACTSRPLKEGLNSSPDPATIAQTQRDDNDAADLR